MNKSDMTNRNVIFMQFVFYCFHLKSTSGHSQKKILRKKKKLFCIVFKDFLFLF